MKYTEYLKLRFIARKSRGMKFHFNYKRLKREIRYFHKCLMEGFNHANEQRVSNLRKH